MAEEALLEQVPGAAGGSARMAAAATEDVLGARKHPGTPAAAGEDRGPGAAQDRPEGEAREQSRRRRRYEVVTGTMQRALNQLDEERRVPVLG
jgi:hypothetical protein